MKQIKDKEILDEIIKGLECKKADNNGKASISYEDTDKDIYIEASVVWDIRESENWITIDGRSYYEGTYTDVVGWDDLQVDAWIGNDKVEVDMEYIEKNLTKQL